MGPGVHGHQQSSANGLDSQNLRLTCAQVGNIRVADHLDELLCLSFSLRGGRCHGVEGSSPSPSALMPIRASPQSSPTDRPTCGTKSGERPLARSPRHCAVPMGDYSRCIEGSPLGRFQHMSAPEGWVCIWIMRVAFAAFYQRMFVRRARGILRRQRGRSPRPFGEILPNVARLDGRRFF